MPAIADQVADIEHDLQEALAKIDSLTEEKETLRKALTAVTVEKSDLEARYSEQQLLVDETREMVDKLANISLTMLRTSRRQVGTPQVKPNGRVSEGKAAPTGTDSDLRVAAQNAAPELTGQSMCMRRVSQVSSEKTASERLRADLLFETTAARALAIRSEPTDLPEGMPMFLQSVPRAALHARV